MEKVFCKLRIEIIWLFFKDNLILQGGSLKSKPWLVQMEAQLRKYKAKMVPSVLQLSLRVKFCIFCIFSWKRGVSFLTSTYILVWKSWIFACRSSWLSDLCVLTISTSDQAVPVNIMGQLTNRYSRNCNEHTSDRPYGSSDELR